MYRFCLSQFARSFLGLLLLFTLGASPLRIADDVAQAPEPPFSRKSDVIYGRKYGMALTLDVFTPTANANGAAVVWVVSGGWFSTPKWIAPESPTPDRALSQIRELVKRGYTVFAVVHGSQPKFTIPEAIEDVHRAVRFIRFHAKDFQIDPDRLGITGGSSGGHLALMIGTAGAEGDAKAKDPVDRESSRVQAVACFFPLTDFLNWGAPGNVARGLVAAPPPLRAAYDFQEFDTEERLFVPVTDEAKRLEIYRQISPITHVSADDPPTLIIHGDKDRAVPIQQSETIVARFNAVGVPAELVVKEGAGHGWPDLPEKDMPKIVGWFDEHLEKK